MERTEDRPSVIVISRNENDSSRPMAVAFMKLGNGNDYVTTIDGLASKNDDDGLPAEVGGTTDYPIYMIIPPNELQEFFATNKDRNIPNPENFVFFSGGLVFGNIEDLLKDRGYCRDQMTQVLISGCEVIQPMYIVRDLKVSTGIDSYGEDKMAGECVVCGKWSGSIAERFGNGDVYCRIDFYREWRRKMWERSVYDTVLNIIGAVRDDPTTVANVAQYYTDEISDIVWEFSQLVRGWKAITLTYGFEDRMISIAEQRGIDQQCSITNEMYPYIWGNPIYLQSKTYLAYLYYAQVEKNLLPGIQLPTLDENTQSNMRQGNLRADGVV